jgi:tRNA-(ms[2]io[6]A)-hydroxylase
LLDMLLVGAVIEARSCERFARLVPRLPAAIAKFYAGLLASEARHFEHYLGFALSETGVAREERDERLAEILVIEAELITEPDSRFRFHSGPPAGE